LWYQLNSLFLNETGGNPLSVKKMLFLSLPLAAHISELNSSLESHQKIVLPSSLISNLKDSIMYIPIETLIIRHLPI
jgi:hypothetical protein